MLDLQRNPKEINLEGLTQNYILTGHNKVVRGVAICKQRSLLASGSDDETVKLWNLYNNSLLKTYLYQGGVQDVAFSNQGDLLAFCGGGDYSIKLIDISDLNNEKIVFELKGHKDWVRRLIFSNNSEYLISGSVDETIRVWDIKQKKQSFYLNTENQVHGIAISSDDTLIASNSCEDGKIRIWAFQNKKLLCTQQAHTQGAGIQFSNDAKMLASSAYDKGTIKLWGLEQSNQISLFLIRKFSANNCIWTVLFSPCSKYMIFVSNQDREVKVIDSITGQVAKIFQSKATNDEDFIFVAMSNDMEIIAYGENYNVIVWRPKI